MRGEGQVSVARLRAMMTEDGEKHMSNELAGKRIAFLVANAGVEQVELTSPWRAVKDAGGLPAEIAAKEGNGKAMTT